MKLKLSRYLITTFLLAASLTKADPFFEREDLGLTKYRPIYFLGGNPTSKLQFSFKYQLITVWPLYIGYTQYMFWELLHESSPFRDVNYNPEIFNRIPLESGVLDSLDVGYEHLSNWQPGRDSRSIDNVFVEAHFQGPANGGNWESGVRLRQPVRKDWDHGDYDRYAGGRIMLTGRLTQVLGGIFDQGSVHLKIVPGGAWAEEVRYGNQEIGFSFRLGGIDLNPSIFIQYFHGYSETMLNYTHEEQHVRVGILL